MMKVSVIAALGAALVLVSGCSSTSAKKKVIPYKGVMSDRGTIPPAYSMNTGKPQSLKTSAIYSDEVPAPTAKLTVDDAFVAGPADDAIVESPVQPVAPAPAETVELQADAAAVDAAAPAPQASTRKFPVIENGRTPSKGLAGKGAGKGRKEPAAKSGAAPTAGGTYVVKSGDVLSRIAKAHGVKVSDIMALNPKLSAPNKIYVGQELVMPAGAGTASVASAAAPAASAKAPAAKSASKAGKEPIPADGMYTVVNNDSLWKIGHRYGISSSDLRAWNGLTTDRLKIGQQLKLRPDGAAAAPAAAPAAAAPAAAEPAPALSAGESVPAPVETAAPVVEAVADGAAPAASSFMDYVVMEGDTIDTICGSFELDRGAFLKDNPQIANDSDLKPGMTVRVMLR